MKPQVLHRVISQTQFFKTSRYGKHSTTVSAVELRNKIQRQLKDILFEDLSRKKIKTIISNFYLTKSY